MPTHSHNLYHKTLFTIKSYNIHRSFIFNNVQSFTTNNSPNKSHPRRVQL